jgi:hypothetical protein
MLLHHPDVRDLLSAYYVAESNPHAQLCGCVPPVVDPSEQVPSANVLRDLSNSIHRSTALVSNIGDMREESMLSRRSQTPQMRATVPAAVDGSKAARGAVHLLRLHHPVVGA